MAHCVFTRTHYVSILLIEAGIFIRKAIRQFITSQFVSILLIEAGIFIPVTQAPGSESNRQCFNPLNRGGDIHTSYWLAAFWLGSLVSILLIEAGIFIHQGEEVRHLGVQ